MQFPYVRNETGRGGCRKGDVVLVGQVPARAENSTGKVGGGTSVVLDGDRVGGDGDHFRNVDGGVGVVADGNNFRDYEGIGMGGVEDSGGAV